MIFEWIQRGWIPGLLTVLLILIGIIDLNLTKAEPPPPSLAPKGSSGVRYAGPIVYTNEQPPVIHFPPPPKGGNAGNYGKGGNSHSVKYIPLPHHDLPVLIYQSDITPPIHVVHPPFGGQGGVPKAYAGPSKGVASPYAHPQKPAVYHHSQRPSKYEPLNSAYTEVRETKTKLYHNVKGQPDEPYMDSEELRASKKPRGHGHESYQQHHQEQSWKKPSYPQFKKVPHPDQGSSDPVTPRKKRPEESRYQQEQEDSHYRDSYKSYDNSPPKDNKEPEKKKPGGFMATIRETIQAAFSEHKPSFLSSSKTQQQQPQQKQPPVTPPKGKGPQAPPRLNPSKSKPTPLPHIIYAGHPPIHIFQQPPVFLKNGPGGNKEPQGHKSSSSFLRSERGRGQQEQDSSYTSQKPAYKTPPGKYGRDEESEVKSPRGHRYSGGKPIRGHHQQEQRDREREIQAHYDYMDSRPRPHRPPSPPPPTKERDSEYYSQSESVGSPAYKSSPISYKAPPPQPPPQQPKGKGKYVPAPPGWKKPPIIIYQGIKPPVHMFEPQVQASGYDAGYSTRRISADSGVVAAKVDEGPSDSSGSASAGTLSSDVASGRSTSILTLTPITTKYWNPASQSSFQTAMYVSDLTSAGTSMNTGFRSDVAIPAAHVPQSSSSSVDLVSASAQAQVAPEVIQTQQQVSMGVQDVGSPSSSGIDFSEISKGFESVPIPSNPARRSDLVQSETIDEDEIAQARFDSNVSSSFLAAAAVGESQQEGPNNFRSLDVPVSYRSVVVQAAAREE